jgi:hypothetical protein
MILTKDHMSRTFDMLDYAKREPNSPTAKVCMLLGDCWPTGRRADMEQATMKQLHYIRSLVGLEFNGPNSEGWDFLLFCQGHQMSKTQGRTHHRKTVGTKGAPIETT